MKRNLGRKLLSILLSVTMVVSVMTVGVASTTVYAGVASFAIEKVADKLIELGVRGVCEMATELSEDASDSSKEVVDSAVEWLLMDPAEAAASQAVELCEEILSEISDINESLTSSTNYISTQINRGFSATVKDEFDKIWTNDVTAPIKNNGLNVVYEKYVYYFVACALYNNSKLLENESIYNTVSEKWPSLVKNEITEDVISKAKSDLNAAFLKADDHGSSEKDVYGTSIVNNKFIRALDALTDNYVHGTGTYEQGETSVASAAATCAYYYFPYSYQQYQFIESKTNQQILVTTVLAMAYNEFLSYQGEYLSNNYTGDWSNQVELEHTSSSDSGQTIKQTYSELKKQYTDEWGIIGESIVELYTSTLYIDASSFTGSLDDITTNFNQYMRVEDSVAVNLSIQGYENEVSYYQELKDHDQLPFNVDVDGDTDVTKSNYIPSTLKFNRVMTGVKGEVYYILDPTQFKDSNALNISTISHRIKREGWFGDPTIGDLYEVSCDYLNLIKTMSDGVNSYACPKNLNTSLASLFNSPTYSAVSGNTPSNYLQGYLPEKASGDTYLLSADYTNDFGGSVGYGLSKSGNVTLGNLTAQANNYSYVDTKSYEDEDLNGSSSHKYSLILANTDDTYKQNARISYSQYNTVEDAKIVCDGKEYTSEQSFKSGSNITVKFKFDPDEAKFVSLKCIRNNAEATETVLIDGEDELEYFYNEDSGYYEFDTYMPYSDTTFYFESYKNGGDFTIRNYYDLVKMAEDVNSGEYQYVYGTYTVIRDVDINGVLWEPIGTESVNFNGILNGNGHTISGLNVGLNSGEGNMHGLFANIGEQALVENLTLSNFDVFSNVGGSTQGSGVIARQNYGTIKNCLVTDSSVQEGNYNYLGGIAGVNYGKIENCGVANTSITRRWGGSSDATMGGITQTNSGTVKSCYTYNCSFNNGTSSNAPIVAYGNEPKNCYYYTSSTVNKKYGTEKTSEQFTSGEVAYLLNWGNTDGTQAWYQNIDNGLTPDDYPVLVNNGQNTVYYYKIDGDVYTNNSLSALDSSDLTVYHRIYNQNGSVSSESKTVNGCGVVDNDTKTITVYTLDTVDRIGILYKQGADDTVGYMSLKGYDRLDKTSSDILKAHETEPDIYVDANGCIFIKIGSETNEDLTLIYDQIDTETTKYISNEYKLVIKVVDPEQFETISTVSKETVYEPTEESVTTPDDNSSTSDDVKSSTSSNDDKSTQTSTNSGNGTVKTGNTMNIVIPIALLISLFVGVFIYRRKESK